MNRSISDRPAAAGAGALIGGSLRANDPRLFLVEFMVGAIHADGHVDEREVTTLTRLLGEHELFGDLSASVRSVLLESATETLTIWGGSEDRIKRAAKSLCWRLHRLAAYSMAAELVAADDIITADEERYLRTLRRHLIVDSSESDTLISAAKGRRAIGALDGLLGGDLPAKVARLCAAEQRATHQHLDAASIASGLANILDFEGALLPTASDIELLAETLPEKPGGASIELAGRIRGQADRRWSVTYALAINGGAPWRDRPFFNLIRLGFELSERALDRATEHAERWSPSKLETTRHASSLILRRPRLESRTRQPPTACGASDVEMHRLV